MLRYFASDFLEPSDWSKLSPFIREESYLEAQEILSFGETCDYIFFCIEGHIQLILNIEKTLLVRLQAGEIAGELPYLINPESSVSILAESGSKVVRIPHKNLIELFLQDRDFEYRFLKYVSLMFANRLSHARRILRLKDAKNEIVEQVTPLFVDGISYKHLSNESDINKAMALLHEAYISELGWKIVPGNPSRLRVETDKSGELLLVDKFSDTADWFGAFKNNELVGCFRLLRYPHHELSEYIDLPKSLNHECSCEINRLAVAKEYRNSIVTLLLLRITVDYAFTIGNVIFATAAKPELMFLFQKLGLHSYEMEQFKYNVLETDPVNLLWLSNEVSDGHTAQPWHRTRLYRLSERLLHPRKPTDQGLSIRTLEYSGEYQLSSDSGD